MPSEPKSATGLTAFLEIQLNLLRFPGPLHTPAKPASRDSHLGRYRTDQNISLLTCDRSRPGAYSGRVPWSGRDEHLWHRGRHPARRHPVAFTWTTCPYASTIVLRCEIAGSPVRVAPHVAAKHCSFFGQVSKKEHCGAFVKTRVEVQ